MVHGKPTCGLPPGCATESSCDLEQVTATFLICKMRTLDRSASRFDLVGDVGEGVETVANFPNKVSMQLPLGGLVGGLLDLVSETSGQPVIFEFQIYNQYSVV